ncbi:MAG TPA: VWA domain-containing protein [Acidobacteriaceae bacterium]
MARRMCGVGVVLLAGWAAALMGQAGSGSAGQAANSQATGEQPIATFHTNANLVVVDVVVRDRLPKGGQPVKGLPQSEFHILENGKEQKITAFEEHKATDAIRSSAAPDLPAHVYSDTPEYTIQSAANVLLLDAMNTPLSDQVEVRTRMVRDLEAIPNGTQIAVFKLDRKLHILSGFTTDKDAIAKLLLKGPGLPENSPVYDRDFTTAMNQLSGLAAEAGGTPLMQQNMQTEAQQNANFQAGLGAEFTMDAFTQLARYLSTIPGRKNLIWYTARIPFSLPTGSNATPSGTGATMDIADFSGQMQKMLELLAVARVAVYPVDSRGLATHPHDWDHLNMDEIAEVTGGKAYYNTNATGEALPAAIANGSDYYTLAYAPSDHTYNGAPRSIAVKLEDHENYALEYRRGYFADDPAKRDQLMAGRTSPLIDAMQHGSPELSQVIFDVRVLPASDPEVKGEVVTAGPAGMITKDLKHTERYMVDYWVDPRGLDGKPLPKGLQERDIEVTQVAYGSEGIRENYTDVPVSVTLSPAKLEEAQREGVELHQQIDLPEGKGYLRIGVHDMISGRIGTVEIPVDVRK